MLCLGKKEGTKSLNPVGKYTATWYYLQRSKNFSAFEFV